MENKLKHLEFIQLIITRMNVNSFLLKGWCVTIVAAVFALYASNQNNCIIIIGILPTLVFWFLDAYYLTQERKFRGLYNDVAGVSNNPKQLKEFEMRPDLYTGGKYNYFNVLISKTIWLLYLPLSFILIGLYIYLK
ncbi:MAG: hypothetical protein ACOCP4_02340 [Candidatus Woesearchaeota archaeon]